MRGRPAAGASRYFYGFVGGETNQYSPALYEGTTPVEPPDDPSYHLTVDLADKAIAWVRQQKALMPDKPFFAYFAPGACHAPHHVPKEWADKYKGEFDDGWDALREKTFAEQRRLGVVPSNAELTKRHAEIPAWADTPAELRPVLAREMEVYAAFLEHTDHHIGRLIDAIEALGVLDDTLVVVIIGDNGASAEGTLQGTFNELLLFNGMSIETPEFLSSRIDQLGGPQSYNHYAVGWAHALDTPYQWTKQIASHWGGTRNGTVVHWPNGIAARGELRHQFCHVIDVAPTILEAAGLPEPRMVHGVTQSPMEGTSMLYSFDDAIEPERHDVQYFEIFGNRGIYHKGWSAITKHRAPWEFGAAGSFDEDVWELYDGTKDWTQAHDLAAAMPEKLEELERLWMIEAAKYGVFPLDDRTVERLSDELAGRPRLVRGHTQRLFRGMGPLAEQAAINVKNKSFAVTASVVVSEEARGVIIAQGGAFGGWSLYVDGGRAKFAYNLCGVSTFTTTADRPLPAGQHQVRMEFAYDGGGFGKGGTVSLLYDGQRVGQGRVERTVPFMFSADETMDVGVSRGTPVSTDYDRRAAVFNGRIDEVEIQTGEEAVEAVNPKERLKIAIARQ